MKYYTLTEEGRIKYLESKLEDTSGLTLGENFVLGFIGDKGGWLTQSSPEWFGKLASGLERKGLLEMLK